MQLYSHASTIHQTRGIDNGDDEQKTIRSTGAFPNPTGCRFSVLLKSPWQNLNLLYEVSRAGRRLAAPPFICLIAAIHRGAPYRRG
jgi:hypothetical protein